jgi:hypothetical protein
MVLKALPTIFASAFVSVLQRYQELPGMVSTENLSG